MDFEELVWSFLVELVCQGKIKNWPWTKNKSRCFLWRYTFEVVQKAEFSFLFEKLSTFKDESSILASFGLSSKKFICCKNPIQRIKEIFIVTCNWGLGNVGPNLQLLKNGIFWNIRMSVYMKMMGFKSGVMASDSSPRISERSKWS